MLELSHPVLAFPLGKSGQEISREIWGFELSRSQGNLCRDLGKFFCVSKDFKGTDIYHSDIKKKCVSAELIFFCLLKVIFQNSQFF